MTAELASSQQAPLADPAAPAAGPAQPAGPDHTGAPATGTAAAPAAGTTQAGPAAAARDRPPLRGVVVERGPAPRQRRRRAGRGYRLAGALVVVAALIIAGTLALTGPHGNGPAAPGTGSGPPGATAQARAQAADWVASQTGPAAAVSCDPAMCRVLRAHGISAARLDKLGAPTGRPLSALLVVATPAIRAQFGKLLSSLYAPAVLATFGTGAARIDIRQAAPHGAAAYWAALRADQRSRRSAGAELLSSNRIGVSATARQQLEAGQADSRLLITMAGLAVVHPVYIVGFGNTAPGASPGIPLRFADVTPASTGQAGHLASAGFARSMMRFLQVQQAPFVPIHAWTVHLPGGQAVFRIDFAAPSPLGLLGQHRRAGG